MDYLHYVDRLLMDGEAVVEKVVQYPGGSAANTIYALAKLGVKTGFIGAVGADEAGKPLLADFEKVGVDTSHIRVKERENTGTVLGLYDKLGRRSLYVVPGANSSLAPHDVDLAYINQAKILHLSSFVHDQQLAVQSQIVTSLAPEVLVSFSPGEIYAVKGLASLAPLLRRTRFFFLNYREVRLLTGEDFVSGARQCQQQGCHTVVVTLGKGVPLPSPGGKLFCYILAPDKEHRVESPPGQRTSAQETTGAGDAFAAGFIYGYLQEKGLEECAQLGDTMARFCIRRIGARAGLPSLARLTQSYQRYWGGLRQAAKDGLTGNQRES